MISHRYITVRDADQIYVLDNGHVIEHGNHDQLKVAAGTYVELFTPHAKACADSPNGHDEPDPQLVDVVRRPRAVIAIDAHHDRFHRSSG